MKKTIISLAILCATLTMPMFASASIDTNLYYGIKNISAVKELQEFLIDRGFLNYQATGNFFSLTLSAVRKYQTSEGITPTGYVGILTRTSINNQLAKDLEQSNQEQNIEAPVQIIPTPQPIMEQSNSQTSPPTTSSSTPPAPTPVSSPAPAVEPVIAPAVIVFKMDDAVIEGTVKIAPATTKEIHWSAQGDGLVCNNSNATEGKFIFDGSQETQTFTLKCLDRYGAKTEKSITITNVQN